MNDIVPSQQVEGTLPLSICLQVNSPPQQWQAGDSTATSGTLCPSLPNARGLSAQQCLREQCYSRLVATHSAMWYQFHTDSLAALVSMTNTFIIYVQ